MATKIDFKIKEGVTFRETLRWESATKVYKPISLIENTAPVRVRAVGHGLTNGWRVLLTGFEGVDGLSRKDYYQVSNVTTDTFEINSVNATSLSQYIAKGTVEYNQPINLAGYTAIMQIRSPDENGSLILELTTENGGIVITPAENKIDILVSAAQTSTLSFDKAVYGLNLISGTEVVNFVNGSITLEQGVVF
jgi:hypothetical protein